MPTNKADGKETSVVELKFIEIDTSSSGFVDVEAIQANRVYKERE